MKAWRTQGNSQVRTVNETSQEDNSLYQRYSSRVLLIDGIAALGFVLFFLWCVAIHPREPGPEVVIGIALWGWCFFCLPVSIIWLAIASATRHKDRKTKVVQLCCLLFLIFWVLLFLACLQ
jgi:hypothetical protein